MPPVLHITFHKLSRSRAQNVVTRNFWRGVHESHDILQLIAKSVGAARLIKRRATPQPATQCLIHQPAVQQKIRGQLRSFYFNRAQDPIPITLGLLQSGCDISGIAKSVHKTAYFFFVVTLSEEKSHLSNLSR